jgi:hypothetical protein
MSQEISINIKESINQNAQRYYTDYKKYKKKLDGLDIAIAETEKKLATLGSKKIEIKEIQEKKKLAWFEKYHWGFTRNGLLIIAGKDSQSNEYIVKNYLEKDDLLFHSTIQGSAHVILKQGQKAEREDLEDCSTFAAVFSKAWSLGFASVDVYFVYPDQVSKTAESGEYLSQGAFVIRGEKNFFKKTLMTLCLGIVDINKYDKTFSGKRIFIGSESLFKVKNIDIVCQVVPGKDKKGDIAKQIHNKLDKENKLAISLDEIIQCLPPGTMEFVKNKKKK